MVGRFPEVTEGHSRAPPALQGPRNPTGGQNPAQLPVLFSGSDPTSAPAAKPQVSLKSTAPPNERRLAGFWRGVMKTRVSAPAASNNHRVSDRGSENGGSPTLLAAVFPLRRRKAFPVSVTSSSALKQPETFLCLSYFTSASPCFGCFRPDL